MAIDTSMLAFPKDRLCVEEKRAKRMAYESRGGWTCQLCGKPARRPSKTCGRRCGYELRKMKLRSRKSCPVCRKEYWPVMHRSGWSKHCSAKCAYVTKAKRPAMVQVKCAECFRVFRRTQGAVKRTRLTFCNKHCQRLYFRGEQAPTWRGGHDPNRGPKWLALARQIRDRDGHVCTRCGLTEAENGQKLDVDHIQPWRALVKLGIDVANDPRNLTSLCRKCHRWKTAHVDTAWLKRGDCLTMTRYQQQVKLKHLDIKGSKKDLAFKL